MTTGLPATSLPATCGSEPIAFAPPFGDRQGTRLKMSPADFATCFTLSMARAVMPRCSADGWVAATVVWDGEAGAGLADCVGAGVACAACAWAGACATGVSNSRAAAADAARHAFRRKGRRELI